MRIIWDEPKRKANIDKHGLDFAQLTEEFFATATIKPAKLGRKKAIGVFLDATLAVIYAEYGSEAVSIISMRDASPKERKELE
ncbi:MULTISPECIES: BrnT family toxin [unclassified Bradyrhizobium]